MKKSREIKNKEKRDRYNNDKEYYYKLKNYKLKYKINNAEKLMFFRIKSVAKNKGILFNITEDYLKEIYKKTNNLCSVLNIPLFVDKKLINSPSLDRINPDLGYVFGNIRIISLRANKLKNNATLFELEKIYNDSVSISKFKIENNLSKEQLRIIALMFMRAKKRAKIRNIEFNLTKDYLLQLYPKDDICPILGFKMFVGKIGNIYAQSLDRIDNNLGYIIGNVRIISTRANKLKNDATKEELKLIYEDALTLNNIDFINKTNNSII